MLPILLLVAVLYCVLPFVIAPLLVWKGIFPTAPWLCDERQEAAFTAYTRWPLGGIAPGPGGATPFFMILWPYVLAVYLFEWRQAGREIEKHTETWRGLNARLEAAGDEPRSAFLSAHVPLRSRSRHAADPHSPPPGRSHLLGDRARPCRRRQARPRSVPR